MKLFELKQAGIRREIQNSIDAHNVIGFPTNNYSDNLMDKYYTNGSKSFPTHSKLQANPPLTLPS